jgi:FkbM family methyltransferase
MRGLQCVPVRKAAGVLYIDLRMSAALGHVRGDEPEALEMDLMRAVVRTGDTALDIGAHLGTHALVLAECVGEEGTVSVFEPNPLVLPLLQRTLHGLTNVRVLEFALGAEEGTVSLYVPPDASMASMGDWAGTIDPRSTRVYPCERETLDRLFSRGLFPPPHFIKCDVEGAEGLVLRGGSTLLASSPPIVLMEINLAAARELGQDPLDPVRLLAAVPDAGYRFWRIRPGPSLVPADSTQLGLLPCENVLAVPARAGDRIAPLVK